MLITVDGANVMMIPATTPATNLVAAVDVSAADWRKCGTCGGVADRRAHG